MSPYGNGVLGLRSLTAGAKVRTAVDRQCDGAPREIREHRGTRDRARRADPAGTRGAARAADGQHAAEGAARRARYGVRFVEITIRYETK